MNKLRTLIIPFIVFIIVLAGSINIVEKGAEDGKYEKEVFVNDYGSKVLTLKTIENDLAAVSVDNDVLLMKEEDKHVIKEGLMEYAGSFKVLEIKRDSAIIAFDIHKTNKYYYLTVLCVLFALLASLMVHETIKPVAKK